MHHSLSENARICRDRVERRGHDRTFYRAQGCSVAAVGSAGRGRWLTGKSVTESNLSPARPRKEPPNLYSAPCPPVIASAAPEPPYGWKSR